MTHSHPSLISTKQRQRIVRRKHVARIVMLRGLGFSTEKIGQMISSERVYSQSTVSKQLRRIRSSVIDRTREPSDQTGNRTPIEVFKKQLFWLEDIDSDDLVALGTKKYDYHDLIRKGNPPLQVLMIVAPEFKDIPKPYHLLTGK